METIIGPIAFNTEKKITTSFRVILSATRSSSQVYPWKRNTPVFNKLMICNSSLLATRSFGINNGFSQNLWQALSYGSFQRYSFKTSRPPQENNAGPPDTGFHN